MTDLSIIIPVYNEEDSVRKLYKQLIEMELPKTEIIFVDDGSTDDTLYNLIELKNIKIIELRKNFGKSIALSEAFKIAKGNLILMMDGDLQDDPNDIFEFIESMYEYDFVIGWRKERKDKSSKVFVSKKIYNFLNKIFFGLNIHDSNCGMKIMKKKCLPYAMLGSGMHRYMPQIMHANGFKVGECVVHHHERKYGKSKYGFFRLFKGAFDMLMMAIYLKIYVIGSNNIKKIYET